VPIIPKFLSRTEVDRKSGGDWLTEFSLRTAKTVVLRPLRCVSWCHSEELDDFVAAEFYSSDVISTFGFGRRCSISERCYIYHLLIVEVYLEDIH